MRKLALVVIVTAALALTGCAASTEAKSGAGTTTARNVDLPDGGTVTCVFWVPIDTAGVASAEGAQMSCDWGN